MNRRLCGNTYSTICGKLSAIRWYHRNNLGFNPDVNASHLLLLQGIRRFTDPVRKQQPITVPLLLSIRGHLDLTRPRHQLLWGGLLLAYFFLLRRSEYLFIGNKTHDYVLLLRHVLFLDEDGRQVAPRQACVVGLKLTGAKNNQYGREDVRYQFKSGHDTLCPVLAARWIRKASKHFRTAVDQPALSTSPTSGITTSDVSSVIKQAAVRCGFDPGRFSTHSIRIGGATKLLNAGADRLVIKLLGRWLSNTFEEYPVLTAEGSRDIARLMC